MLRKLSFFEFFCKILEDRETLKSFLENLGEILQKWES